MPARTEAAAKSQTADNELANEVGEHAIDIVTDSDLVLFGELALVSADSAAMPSSLASPDRVAGYPTSTGLRSLDALSARSTGEAFVDWDNYDPSWRSRCKIDRIHGFRFTRGDERVDIALTDPCWLAIWTFRRDTRFYTWAAAFNVHVGPKLVPIETSSRPTSPPNHE